MKALLGPRETSARAPRLLTMKRLGLPFFATFFLLSFAACEKRDPVEEEANAIAPVPVTNSSAGPVAGGPPTTASNADPSGIIPEAVQGRWGLTPADCEHGRSDAKGLLTIGPNDIRFYESLGTPDTSVEKSERAISGNFSMTGEGERWTTYISFKLTGDGLVRTERNPVASYTYAKCD